MNFRLQFLTAVVLCFTFTFGFPADESICDVSFNPAPVEGKLPPAFPAGTSPGFICGFQNKTAHVVNYRQCRTCLPTAKGKKCQLLNNATAPVIESHNCTLAYGPVDLVDITKSQKYYCKDDQNYSCGKIENATVCDECTSYSPIGTTLF
ncbi:uncharacterized protein MELLADRAFT_107498 [Melampsora larici-populina 98AG31]|uniref:Secreted protein n=1 Tax=Melampsora larici-populina (strain 98AG31 / pathotype 3-4-7) TaxID=747676 RepID=F4RQ04_MELLP|nr:uncharacterized protein MELLADRAFT_107498 [Melampsora larici-populina 98AG31]EGG05640.1 secreted protein [Melampsora larici-populina 98AG31]